MGSFEDRRLERVLEVFMKELLDDTNARNMKGSIQFSPLPEKLMGKTCISVGADGALSCRIIINSLETDAGKVYALLHEIGHVRELLRKAGKYTGQSLQKLAYEEFTSSNLILEEASADHYALSSLMRFDSEIYEYVEQAWRKLQTIRKNIFEQRDEYVKQIAESILRFLKENRDFEDFKNIALKRLVHRISKETRLSERTVLKLLNEALLYLKRRGKISYWYFLDESEVKLRDNLNRIHYLNLTRKIFGSSSIIKALKEKYVKDHQRNQRKQKIMYRRGIKPKNTKIVIKLSNNSSNTKITNCRDTVGVGEVKPPSLDEYL